MKFANKVQRLGAPSSDSKSKVATVAAAGHSKIRPTQRGIASCCLFVPSKAGSPKERLMLRPMDQSPGDSKKGGTAAAFPSDAVDSAWHILKPLSHLSQSEPPRLNAGLPLPLAHSTVRRVPAMLDERQKNRRLCIRRSPECPSRGELRRVAYRAAAASLCLKLRPRLAQSSRPKRRRTMK